MTAKPLARMNLIAALSLSGDLDAARAEAGKLKPDELFANTRPVKYCDGIKRDIDFRESYIRALIAAGAPTDRK